MKNKLQFILPIILLLALCVVALTQAFPTIREVPFTDSGLFLYGGQQILRGGLPYRDLFEHKPPGIFYIDALGLLIGGQSRWGVWFLQFLALGAAAVLSFILLKKLWGVLPAFFGTFWWIIASFVYIDHGNTTEQYALPLQFAALFLFIISEKEKNYKWRGYLIGALGGAAFMIKQPMIGIWIAITIYLLATRIKNKKAADLKQSFLPIAIGGIGFTAAVFLFFFLSGELKSFWEAAFMFNVAYAKTSFAARFNALLYGMRQVTIISIIMIIGYIGAIYNLFFSKMKDEDSTLLLKISLIILPLELAFASLAGRPYRHYYNPWLVPYAVFLGYTAFLIVKTVGGVSNNKDVKYNMKGIILSLVIFIVLTIISIHQPGSLLKKRTLGVLDDGRKNAVEYIKETTNEDDYVVIWGTEPSVNVVSNRRSSTRLVMAYHLFLPDNRKKVEMSKEFLRDLKERKPRVILDATLTSELMVPPLHPEIRQQWEMYRRQYFHSFEPIPEYQEIYDYIMKNYDMIGFMDVYSPYCTQDNKQKWFVFRLKAE